MSGLPPMDNSGTDDLMASGQDFNMDDYVHHSGTDPDYYYLDEEPSSTTASQEQLLAPQFNFNEESSSTMVSQEQPLASQFNFNDELNSTLVSQEQLLAPQFNFNEELSSTIMSQETQFNFNDEPGSIIMPQEQPLALHFTFDEEPTSTIVSQEQPSASYFNFNEEPNPTVTSQESSTPYCSPFDQEIARIDAAYLAYMGGHAMTSPSLVQQVNGLPEVHLGQGTMSTPNPLQQGTVFSDAFMEQFGSIPPNPMGQQGIISPVLHQAQGAVSATYTPSNAHMGQDAMSAPDTFQQGNVYLTPPVEQDDTFTSPTLPAQATNQAVEQTSPATPPAAAPRRANNPGPRGYRRSMQACTRCRKNKLKCDDEPQGCSNCAATGNTCMVATMSGGEVPRMHANNIDNLLQAFRRHVTDLEARLQAQGGYVPNRPADLGHW